MEKIHQSREVPVVGNYDVVVCGGGPSGIIAAIAAAKGGAKTAIIERYGFFGGMATAGLVAPISVFNYNGSRIIDGLPWMFIEKLAEIGGAREEKPLGNITFSPEKYKLIAQRLLLQEGVVIYFHSYLTDCVMDGGKITHVIIENKNGAEAIAGRYFIDATGDADLGRPGRQYLTINRLATAMLRKLTISISTCLFALFISSGVVCSHEFSIERIFDVNDLISPEVEVSGASQGFAVVGDWVYITFHTPDGARNNMLYKFKLHHTSSPDDARGDLFNHMRPVCRTAPCNN